MSAEIDPNPDGSCPECGHSADEHSHATKEEGCTHPGCACKLVAYPDPLPCPFCGSAAWVSPFDPDAVACSEIECALGFMNPPHIDLAAWNKRAPCPQCGGKQ